MASPARAGAAPKSPPQRPLWQRPFVIESDVEVIQPAGQCQEACEVGLVSAVSASGPAEVAIVSNSTCGPIETSLPELFPGFTERMLQLLRTPEGVKVSARTHFPPDRAVTTAVVHVELLRDDKLLDPSTLRKLFAGASSAAFTRKVKRDKERQQKRQRRETSSRAQRLDVKQLEKMEGLSLPPEVVQMVIRKLPWKERFGSARRVCTAWLEAADTVAPLTSYTARVHKEVNAKPDSVASGSVSTSQASSQGSTSDIHPSSMTPPPSPGTASSGESSGGADSIDRDICPPRTWLKSTRFDECSREKGMALLKDALRELERSTKDEETDALGEDGPGRKQWRRLRPYLAALETVLCLKRGRLVEPRAAPVVLPFGVRLREEVTDARDAARAARVAAARAVASDIGPPPGPSADEDGDDGDQRWDGWRVFAVAIAFAFSEDRPFLCRSFHKSVWGAPGMPLAQIIELLSRMCWALRPPAEVHQQQQQPAAGFQAASRVSTSEWDATGSYRLRMDLVQCIYLMEAHFVRFVRSPRRIEDDAADPSRSGRASQATRPGHGSVDDSMLTNQQRAVVNTKMEVGQTLVIRAYAGTGKTATLKAFAEKNPGLTILYAAYNKTVAVEAGGRFPYNVSCRTLSSLAMSVQGTLGVGKFEPNENKVKEAVEAYVRGKFGGETPHCYCEYVLETVIRFCQSHDAKISDQHVRIPRPMPSTLKDGRRQEIRRPAVQWVKDRAVEVWERMGLLENAGKSIDNVINPSHAQVLKAYQLSKPDLSREYDLIMLDEAQDVNPCQADIVGSQDKCRVIVVGDAHQAIYGWRGARDYLARVKASKTIYLDQCFRFGTALASVANTVLLELNGEKRPLLGSLTDSCLQAEVLSGKKREAFLEGSQETRGKYAFIARTNHELLKEGIAAMGRGDRIAIADGKLPLMDFRDLCYLVMGNVRKVKNRDLKKIGTIDRLRRRVADDPDDTTMFAMGAKLRVIDELIRAGRTPQQILRDMSRIDRLKLTPNSPAPLVILTTVYKAKGLEYDTVVLADDFRYEPLSEIPPNRWRSRRSQEGNLLYVAVTRAKRRLILNATLERRLKEGGKWDSLAYRGLSSHPALGGLPAAPCHGHGCECLDAHGAVVTDNAAGASADATVGGDDVSPVPRLLFAGSGSMAPFCRTCVEGVAAEAGNKGKFPYAGALLTLPTPLPPPPPPGTG